MCQDSTPFYSQITFHHVDAAQFAYFGRDVCCAHLLATVNNGAVSTQIQGFVCTPVLRDFECMPGSVIAGSYADSMFKLLKNWQACFCSVLLFVLDTTTEMTSLKIIMDCVQPHLKLSDGFPFLLE